MHGKTWFRQTLFQESEISIFFEDVSRVIWGVHEKSWFRQAISQVSLANYLFQHVLTTLETLKI